MVYTVENTRMVSTGVGFQKSEGVIDRTDKNAPQIQERPIMFAKKKRSAKPSDKPQTVSTGNDLSRGLAICKEVDKIVDKTDVLRIDTYRRIVARLIQEYPEVEPKVLYSLFFPSDSPVREESITYLKEKNIFSQIETKMARYLADHIFGEAFASDDEKNIRLMTLIDKTRFGSFGWLWQTTYDSMKEEGFFEKEALRRLEEGNFKDAAQLFAGLSDGKFGKLTWVFNLIGEPDQYFIPDVITNAGRDAAYHLSMMIKTQLLLSLAETREIKDIDVRDNKGSTPLHYAAFFGYSEIAKRLVEAKVDINAMNDHRETPLFYAAKAGNIEMVKMLIDAGAWLNVESGILSEETILGQAIWGGHTDIVKLLIDSKKYVDVTGKSPNLTTCPTPLIIASIVGNTDIVTMLILAGAGRGVNYVNNEDVTALMFASEGGFTDIAKILIDNGANVNMQDVKGGTALMRAVKAGHIDMVKLLLDAGANIHKRAYGPKKALDYAIESGNEEIIKLLTEAREKTR